VTSRVDSISAPDRSAGRATANALSPLFFRLLFLSPVSIRVRGHRPFGRGCAQRIVAPKHSSLVAHNGLPAAPRCSRFPEQGGRWVLGVRSCFLALGNGKTAVTCPSPATHLTKHERERERTTILLRVSPGISTTSETSRRASWLAACRCDGLLLAINGGPLSYPPPPPPPPPRPSFRPPRRGIWPGGVRETQWAHPGSRLQ